MSSLAGGTSTDHLHGHRRTTTLDSSMSAAWGRRSSSAAGSSGEMQQCHWVLLPWAISGKLKTAIAHHSYLNLCTPEVTLFC